MVYPTAALFLLFWLTGASAWCGQDDGAFSALRDRYARDETAGMSTDQKIAHWERQSKANPSSLTIALKLAGGFLQKTRETADFSYVDRASSLVDRVLTAEPENYQALRLRIQVAMNHHRFPKVVEYAQVLLERNPSDSGVTALLGDALMEMGQYDKAERAYTRLLDLRGDLISFNRYAWHRFVTGKREEALRWMAQAVASGSDERENEAWCLVEFGDMLFKTGHNDLAEQTYQRALASFQGYHRAHAALGRLLAAKGNIGRAIDHFRKAQATAPFPEYAGMLDLLNRAIGNRQEADRQRAQVDAIDKIGQANGEKANRTLALIYAAGERKLDRALELAKGEVAVRDDVYSHDALAWVLFKSGMIEPALEEITKAIRLGTPEPSFYFHAGMIASAAGRKEDAKRYLSQALALNANFDWLESPIARDKLSTLGEQ
jgi:tetratricopeptide (TPR) repeat protein